jgi:serine/threonine-protein kinase
MRIEAAAWEGKPVFWRLIVPSGDDPPDARKPSSARKTIQDVSNILVNIIVVGGIVFFARKNLRMGRGDRRGATRLTCFLCITGGIAFFCRDHFGSAFAWLVVTGIVWPMYIALEPYVRRRWPNMLIGWNRLLAGDYRDPLVGRDLLYGCLVGIVLFYMPFSISTISSWLGGPSSPGSPAAGPAMGGVDTLYLLSGPRAFVVGVLQLLNAIIRNGLLMALTLFLGRVLLRRTWAAVIVCTLLFTALASLPESPYIQYYSLQPVIVALACCIHYWMLLRFGILAQIAENFFFNLLMFFPIATQPAWYSAFGFAGLFLLLALPLFAFYASFGGQSFFGRTSLED